MKFLGTGLRATLITSCIWGSMVHAAAQIESQVRDFELSSCVQTQQKCISVKAAKAESGSTTPTMMLKDVLVVVTNKKTGKVETYEKKTGFYDIQNQRILLSELTPQKSLKETVFHMKDLSVQQTEMK